MSSDTLDIGVERGPWISQYASSSDARWILAEAKDRDTAMKMLEKGYASSEEEEQGGAVRRLLEEESFEEECEKLGAQIGRMCKAGSSLIEAMNALSTLTDEDVAGPVLESAQTCLETKKGWGGCTLL